MITFVGAGPGDPELITVKGRKALEQADVVVYAGSLVPEDVLTWTRANCEKHNSASLSLDEQISIMASSHELGKTVVRLHTGDPSIYGAIGEQMRELDAKGIAYSVIPGVSSFLAAAAALPIELTLPGVSQTIILTRCAGRTPVPEKENIKSLAAHGATMVLFLSSGLLEETTQDLMTHYSPQTPAALVQRASWKEQKVVRTTLEKIPEEARKNNIDRTALLLVGQALSNEGEVSKLYDATFAHGYREAKDASV